MRILESGLICAFLLLAGAPSAAEGGALDGLWRAEKHYGPAIAGPLILARDGEAYTADVVGVRLEATAMDGVIRFSMPDGAGDFEGRVVAGGAIEGWWIQPATQGISFQRYASPVSLAPAGPGLWRGDIRPLADRMTFYMPVETDETGAPRTLLRNPERNVGVFTQVERLESDGDAVRAIGRFRGRGDEQDFASGLIDPESGRPSLYFDGLGTFDFTRVAETETPGFYPRGSAPAPYIYAPPPKLDDGWPVATLDEAGIDREAISAFIEQVTATPMDEIGASQVHAVLIARGGKLVLEEYFHGADRWAPHDTRSAAKSLTALLAGAAITKGTPLSLSSKVVETVDPALLPADIDPRFREMTLQHLLTMSPGLACNDNDDNSPGGEDRVQELDTDWRKVTLALPMARAPGTESFYCSMSANLAGTVTSYAAGESLPNLFRDLLAGPMGIKHYHMNLAPAGDAYMGGGVYVRPRDFLKLAQLVLNEGRWNGKRLVSEDFIARMTAPQVKIGGRDYGYLWWIEDYPYREGTVRAVFAGGNGGQIAMAIPELDLAIAFMGGSYSDPALFIPQRVYVPERILPAVAR